MYLMARQSELRLTDCLLRASGLIPFHCGGHALKILLFDQVFTLYNSVQEE